MKYFKMFEYNSNEIQSIIENTSLYTEFLKKEYDFKFTVISDTIELYNESTDSDFTFILEYNKFRTVGIDNKLNYTFHNSRMFMPNTEISKVSIEDKVNAMITFAVYALIDYVIKVNSTYFDDLAAHKMTAEQQNKIQDKFGITLSTFGVSFHEVKDYNKKIEFIEYIVEKYPQSLLHLKYLPNTLKVDKNTLTAIQGVNDIGFL